MRLGKEDVMKNKLLAMAISVVLGLSLVPVIGSFAETVTEAPESLTFVKDAVLPASENLEISWTTAPSGWETTSDKAFVSTTADYLFIGIDTSAAEYSVDESSTSLTNETSITLDTSDWTESERTLLEPDALATTYGFTYTDLDDHGAYYDTTIGTMVDLIPLFFVIVIIGGVVVYLKFN
jgi:hypothetical protein